MPLIRLIDGFRYCSHDYWIEAADPRTKHLPLIESGPERVLTILSMYLIFVKIVGPWLMRDRKPFMLRGLLLVYNIFMVVINLFIFYNILKRIDYGRRFLIFKFPDPNDVSPDTLYEIKIGYLCYLTRLLDLFDTIFFVLRKKENQITFLHLYHHTMVPLLGYMTLKIAPQAPVVGLFLMLNTFIHSVMYLYYALAAFGPQVQKYLWWKKYITQLQLLQFAACGFYSLIMIFLQEGFPPGLFWLGFAQNPFFFYMFYDFYRKSYRSKKLISKSDKSL
ncbi:ATP-binding cassette sub-family G member 1 [Sarcoptes scabiei]|nr:ATP-binding cassette sub-family G member 1 [Sarcoptes scabiei]